jgi:hypothetical protein
MTALEAANRPSETRSSSSLVRWAAIIIGTLAGIASLRDGTWSFFVANSFTGVICGVLGMMPLLPLTMLGIFRPRQAAYGMFISATIFLACTFSPADFERAIPLSDALVLLRFAGVPCLVAGLLLYAARDNTESSRTAEKDSGDADEAQNTPPLSAVRERRKQAHWAAVLFGLIGGALAWPWGRHWVILMAKRGDWPSAVGMAAVALTLLPLSIFALFKPRSAAYGVLANLVVMWAYLIFLSSGPPFTIVETFSRILFSVCVSAPFVAIAALLFYASGNHR